MKKRTPTRAEFMAASYICLAVKQQHVDEMRRFEELMNAATGQEKKRLLRLAKQENKNILKFLREGLRCSNGAYCPEGENPSKVSLMAYRKAVTRYVKFLEITNEL